MAKGYTQRGPDTAPQPGGPLPGRAVPALASLSATLNSGTRAQGLSALGGLLNAPAPRGGVVQRAGDLDPEEDDGWLEEWYAKTPDEKSMTADRKFAQILNNVLPDGGKARQKKIDELDWSQLKGPLIDAMLTYQVHMAPFIPETGQGLDRNMRGRKEGTYYRSTEHRLKTAYTRVARRSRPKLRRETAPGRKKAMWPLNKGLLKGVGKRSRRVPPEFDRLSTVQDVDVFDRMRFSHFASLGVTQNPLILLSKAREIVEESGNTSDTEDVPMSALIDLPPRTGRYKGKGRSLLGVEPEDLVNKSLGKLAGLSAPASDEAYREFLVRERGTTSNALSELINDAGMDEISAVGVEGHPSLIIHNAEIEGQPDRRQALKDWEREFLTGLNTGSDPWQVMTAKRGSFGFARPSTAEMLPSLRLWPGFAPFELLAPNVVNALGIDARPSDIEDRTPGDADDPRLYIEALKAAVRHASVAIRRGQAVKPLSDKEQSVRNWLLTRMAINLEKARFLLEMPREAADGSLAQHYQKAISVLERLQEYSFLYTAATFEKRDKEDEADPYLRYLDTAESVQGQHREVFYLDSGMQAINAATLLAGHYDSQGGRKAKMNRPYFETETVRTAMGIKLASRDPSQDEDALILSDLSPVIKDPANRRDPKDRIGRDAHFEDIADDLTADSLPVFDVTNASLRDVDTILDQKPDDKRPRNFLVVESLTKHSQLGTDKYTAGRLIAVGDEDFIAEAKAILQPIADEAYHPLLEEYRRNMDEVLYGDTVIAPAQDWSDDFAANSGRYDAFMTAMGFDKGWADASGRGQAATADPAAGFVLLRKAFDQYVQTVASGDKMAPGYEQAFASLPSSDQATLSQRLERRLLRQTGLSGEAAFSTLLTGASTPTGIENLGATCYLAAGLNMLAFSGYSDFFSAMPDDDEVDAELRQEIGGIIADIRGGAAIDGDSIGTLLGMLRARNLLPPRSAEDIQRGTRDSQIQHDPHEVFFGQLLGHFATELQDFMLEQRFTTTATDRDNAVPQLVNELTQVSTLDAAGQVVSGEPSPQIELPITGVSDLAGALTQYLQLEQIDDWNFIDPQQEDAAYGPGPGMARRGAATRQLSFGNQTPRTLTLVLKRWNILRQKDSRAIDMPERFDLNGRTYRLDAVLHHRGNTGGGHYTTSTRNPDDGNWQYRDDLNVAADPSFAARRPYGYIFTYNLEGDADENRPNMDIRNPPPPAPQLPQQQDSEDDSDDASSDFLRDASDDEERQLQDGAEESEDEPMSGAAKRVAGHKRTSAAPKSKQPPKKKKKTATKKPVKPAAARKWHRAGKRLTRAKPMTGL